MFNIKSIEIDRLLKLTIDFLSTFRLKFTLISLMMMKQFRKNRNEHSLNTSGSKLLAILAKKSSQRLILLVKVEFLRYAADI